MGGTVSSTQPAEGEGESYFGILLTWGGGRGGGLAIFTLPERGKVYLGGNFCLGGYFFQGLHSRNQVIVK